MKNKLLGRLYLFFLLRDFPATPYLALGHEVLQHVFVFFSAINL